MAVRSASLMPMLMRGAPALPEAPATESWPFDGTVPAEAAGALPKAVPSFAGIGMPFFRFFTFLMLLMLLGVLAMATEFPLVDGGWQTESGCVSSRRPL